MRRQKQILQALVFLLPASPVKNRLLRRAGVSIAAGAIVAPNFVWGVDEFVIGARAVIGPFNFFRGLASVHLGEESLIGQLNWISAPPDFVAKGGSYGTFVMRDHATIVSRHHLDCSGGIAIGEYALVAGMHSMFISHQVNRARAELEAMPIEIGAYTLVNAGNRLGPGAAVPARCVTGMGAVILPGLHEQGRLYAGVPAVIKGQVDTAGEFFRRSQTAFGVMKELPDAA